jgi:putative transposase
VIGRLPGETSCLSLVWAVLDRGSRGWRGFTMTPAGLRLLQDLRRTLLEPPHRCDTPTHPPLTAPILSGTWPRLSPSERIFTSAHLHRS